MTEDGAIERHETRLRRLFRRILVGSLAAPAGIGAIAAGACSTLPAEQAAVDACTSQPIEVDAAIVYCGPDQAPYCDPGARCETFRLLPCGPPTSTEARTSCYLSPTDCKELCPGEPYACLSFGEWCEGGVFFADRGAAVVECTYCLNVTGRRPRGLLAAVARSGGDALGEYLAHASHLEAASVVAFRLLGDELRANAAPRALVLGAERAARDEVQHGRVMGRLARARGARPPRVEVRRPARRTLTAVIIENAIEGCVRETFGALVAHWQARHARDPAIASAMHRIAADETRHAALAWAIAGWAHGALSGPERRQVSAAARTAAAALRGEVARRQPSVLVELAGLPPEAMQHEWIGALEQELWLTPSLG